MIQIAIVEDEQQMRCHLADYVKRYEAQSNERFNVSLFSDGAEIVYEYKASYDIIFMDIQMDHMDGFSAAKRIREMDADVILIFITNMANYAIRGYSVKAMDFVLKPVSYFVFSQQLQKAVSQVKMRTQSYLALPIEDGMIRLNVSEVLYIESLNHRLIIHSKDAEYAISGTLKGIEQKLERQHFFRCNNCYLVNMAHVKTIRQKIVSVGGCELQISRPRKKAFMNALTDYIGGNG
jgi:DNA-binding LytR/AlgR family response regulator